MTARGNPVVALRLLDLWWRLVPWAYAPRL